MHARSPILTGAPHAALLTGLLVSTAIRAAPAWAPPPSPSDEVTDLAGVLSPSVRGALVRRLTAYEARSGHQIVVWIDQTGGGVPIEEFAAKSFAAWRVGRAGLDDGLAVFAMTDDRALRIEVGYALESSVTDLAASTVIRTTMIPRIQGGDWDGAVVRGVEALVDIIEGRPEALPAADGGEDAPPLGLPAKIGLGALAALILLWIITHPRRALGLLFILGRIGLGGAAGGGFRGGGGRSGGGGATGRW